MRAAVVQAFHHPVTGVMLQKGHELFDRHDDPDHAHLEKVLENPEIANRVSVTDRTPMAEATPSPAPTPAPVITAPSPAPVSEGN